jgi:hypothetical protein
VSIRVPSSVKCGKVQQRLTHVFPLWLDARNPDVPTAFVTFIPVRSIIVVRGMGGRKQSSRIAMFNNCIDRPA